MQRRRMAIGSERESFALGESAEKPIVGGGETPAPQPGMSDEQAIERIASPTEVERGLEPWRGRRIVQHPEALTACEGCHGRVAEADPAGFDQELQLEEADGRDIEPPGAGGERARPSMPLIKPDERVRVEQNHERGRLLNLMPPAVHCQSQTPAATAGSS